MYLFFLEVMNTKGLLPSGVALFLLEVREDTNYRSSSFRQSEGRWSWAHAFLLDSSLESIRIRLQYQQPEEKADHPPRARAR